MQHPSAPEGLIDLLALAALRGGSFNEQVFQVNDHCLRIAVNADSTYPWHRHVRTDEVFIVLEGCLRPFSACRVPAGTIHRTTAIGRTVNLCIEADGDDTEFMPDHADEAPDRRGHDAGQQTAAPML
jgi:hypothetical protein